MAEELKVYLDHHITRDDFLYRHSNEKISRNTDQDPLPFLRLKDLYGDNSMDRVLRKPDFQRATWAWTPEECVSLLESIVNEQVIPSIIMWRSPEKRWYVLDGGHRISVVLAWLRNDWGESSIKVYNSDQEVAEKIEEAAKAVRYLMANMGIGSFSGYNMAYERIEGLSKEDREYEEEMHSEDAKKAEFYRSILSGSIGFPLQWVKGDYEKAEESFLKINSSGRRLTEWERKLVENRTSSFARVVMSLSNISKAEQCWPTKVSRGENRNQIKSQVNEILDGIRKLHTILFEPLYDPSFSRIQQPLVAEPRLEPDKKPAYLAELFTIIKGGKGQVAQTERLIKEDKSLLSESALVKKGLQLVTESLDVFSHLVGSSPNSLGIIPSLYFYTESGKYVRSMLYGFIYWLFTIDDKNAVLQKKLIFSAYRKPFEELFILNKKEIVSAFGRKVGSGPEVTVQTAKYYVDLLSLLQEHNGFIKSEAFVEDYEKKFKQVSSGLSRPSSTKLPYKNLPCCLVCGSFVDPSVQANQDGSSYTHPFCNSNKSIIESIITGEQGLDLYSVLNPQVIDKPQHLSFLDFEQFDF